MGSKLPPGLYAKKRIIIRENSEMVEFLMHMGYSSSVIAKVIGVTRDSIHNWRTTYRKENYIVPDMDTGAKPPFLVCNRYTFKNMVDPKTTHAHFRQAAYRERAKEIFDNFMKRASYRARKVVEARLSGATWKEISQTYNVNVLRVKFIFEKAMRVLRNRIIRYTGIEKVSIKDLDVDLRTTNILLEHDIFTVGGLLSKSPLNLLSYRNFSERSAKALWSALEQIGIEFHGIGRVTKEQIDLPLWYFLKRIPSRLADD